MVDLSLENSSFMGLCLVSIVVETKLMLLPLLLFLQFCQHDESMHNTTML